MNHKISMIVMLVIMLVVLMFGISLLGKAEDIAEDLSNLNSRQHRIEQLLNEGR